MKIFCYNSGLSVPVARLVGRGAERNAEALPPDVPVRSVLSQALQANFEVAREAVVRGPESACTHFSLPLSHQTCLQQAKSDVGNCSQGVKLIFALFVEDF